MKILVAIDDSDYSRIVVEAVEKRHWPEGTQFKIVSVVEPLPAELRRTIEEEEGKPIKRIEHERKEHAVALCEKVRHGIESAVQGAIVFFEVRDGHPADQIIQSAAEWNADRILIGAHGHSICPHNLPGSVSRAVAHSATCHVEMIRSVPARDRELSRAV